MKSFSLIFSMLLSFQSVFASDTDTSFVKYYLISTDTVATIKIPKGFKSITRQEGTTSIVKISYSDSSYFCYSIGSGVSHRLLEGLMFKQRGIYYWHYSLDDTLDHEYENPKKVEFYGQVHGTSQHWEEDSICFRGFPLIRTAFVWQTDEQRSRFTDASLKLEPYATQQACVEFLKISTYRPIRLQIAGTYEENDGTGGYHLTLKDDFTFQGQGYGDIIFRGTPEPGYRGKYTVKHDTVKLRYEGYIIPRSSSRQWRKTLLQEDAKNRKTGKLREETYLFKIAGGFLFLVKSTRLMDFAKDVVMNGGVPKLLGSRFPNSALSYLTKTK